MVPVLSKGKHGARGLLGVRLFPRRRAMERSPPVYPSPPRRCRRDINDHTSDAGRYRLVPLIPSVVGLNGDDPRVDVGIAARCAVVAFPWLLSHDSGRWQQGCSAPAGLPPSTNSHRRFSMPGICSMTSTGPCQVFPTRCVGRRTSSARCKSNRRLLSVARPGAWSSLRNRDQRGMHPDPDSMLHDLLYAVIDDCTHWFGASIVGSSGVRRQLTDSASR